MAFVLVKEQAVPKGTAAYSVKLYFDEDTNTLRHEYLLDDEVLYYFEYEGGPFVIPEKDIDFDSIVEAFNAWYDIVGPDWRPVTFYLEQ